MREPFLIHHYLDRAARERPDAIAVVDGERSITYRELHRQAGIVAAHLKDAGVEVGDRVGLLFAKSLEAVVSIYGVLTAGAAYVPMDAGAPASRLGYMAQNCGMRVVLSSERKQSAWEGIADSAGGVVEHVLSFGAPSVSGAGEASVVAMGDLSDARLESYAARVIQDDLAYILYTSGSTGEPKGVMLTHENCRSFVQWAMEEFGVTAEDRLSSHAPLHFDLSTFDLFAAAAAGATVVLVPPKVSVFPVEVARFIEANRISVWYSVPSILTMLTERGGLEPGALPGLRTILFAGEVFPTKYLSRLMRLLPHVRFANLYGPTETNVCTWFEVSVAPEESDPPISIGRAISNVETFVVGADGREVQPGATGELYVRGPTVTKGYWGEPERTGERLVPSPLQRHRGDLVYATGDLVEEMLDGSYRFLGRRDNQIKSRGYRIELGDIESAISGHSSIVECAVVAVPDEMITNRIECFVAGDDGLSPDDLTRFCAGLLPKYMVPETFRVLSELPKTSTGKLDRQALLRLVGV